jgi:CheY-like chemotaxis protein
MTLKLFVADDSVTIQKIIGLAFNDEDAVMESVESGDSALDRIRAFKPDVVFADVYMPGCSGYEICAHVKEDPQLSHTPVILLVGTFESFDELEASRVKSDGYLTKPFDTSELIQMVHKLIGKIEMPQENNTPVVAAGNAVQDQSADASSLQFRKWGARGLVSPRAWESFMGANRVLELFDAGTVATSENTVFLHGREPKIAGAKNDSLKPAPAVNSGQLSEDVLNAIVDRVVRRMSPDVIREVAWEVVPELSEVIIRRSIEEGSKS